MRAAIYVRVSTEEQVKEGYSIDAQINVLKLYAKLYDYEVVKVYRDEGLSGKDMKRERLMTMLEDARNHEFDVLLVWKVSRLSRNLKNLLYIVDILDQYKVSFISQSETFNTCSPVGRMTLQILGSIAEFERNTIIENIKLGLDQKARSGQWLGGKVYGYKNINKKLIIDPHEKQDIKYIYEKFSQNKSVRDIAEHLSKKSNREFNISLIYRILKNPIYSGFLRHKSCSGYYEIKGIHEPIISKILFDKVQKKFECVHNEKNNIKEFTLSGILLCPYCCKSLLRYTTSKYRYYRCSTYHNLGHEHCRGFLINANKIENKVYKILEDRICSDSYQKLYSVFEIEEVFNKDYLFKIDMIQYKKRKEIIKYFIKEIILTVDKNIDKISFRQ